MPRKCRGLWVSFLSLLILYCLPVTGQVTANLSGRVTDQTGAAVTAATVTVTNVDTGLSRTTITDQAGRYQVVALPIGKYEIRASKTGFAEQVRSGIVLVVGQDATADMKLADWQSDRGSEGGRRMFPS